MDAELKLKKIVDENYEEMCSGIFSDALDKIGYRNQVVSKFRLNNSTNKLFGKVRTLILEEIETDDERIGLGLNFLGSLSNEEIMVVKGSNDFAYFGELMTRLSMEIGLSGVVIDGLTRDTFYTQHSKLPIFASGYTPKDIKGRGRVKITDQPFEIDGRLVNPGDLVFGDSDAIVIIPIECLDELLPVVDELVKKEIEIKELISKGKSISEILENTDEF